MLKIGSIIQDTGNFKGQEKESYEIILQDGFIKLKNIATNKISCQFPNIKTLEKYIEGWTEL